MKKITFSLCLLSLMAMSVAQNSIIPTPVSYSESDGVFNISGKLYIDVRAKDKDVISLSEGFVDYLKTIGLDVENSKIRKPNSKKRSVLINLSDKFKKELGKEGYKLDVDKYSVKLTAPTYAGLYYGIQSLRQMIDTKRASKPGEISIDCCSIIDFPRFGWRGLMLDVSRHFFPVKDVKAYIDLMAYYKFNVFHWHLTDDQGWRIEIKSLPKLTEVGAWRVERHGRFGSSRENPKPGEKATYGGFYTQEQIKDIVKYAAERNITIVPEIDVPGHAMAILAAYPELSTKKESKFVTPGTKFAEWYGGGKFKMLIENMLNPADEKVYEFVDKVFTEVAQLFPGEYIHMGGDECYHGYWEESKEVQKFMKKNKIQDSHSLQSYFVKRVEKIINSKGKKMIGWDEILDGGLAEGAAVMSWRGMKGGIKAAKMGHNVVMSPTTYAYLDYTQGDHSVENPIYADLSLEKSYEFEALPKDVDEKYILGGQANLWTEVVPNIQYAYYMTYPRAFAISESLWSPAKSKNWNNFMNRTEKHFDIFNIYNKNICKAVYEPSVKVKMDGDKLVCTLNNNVQGTEIYYTIDNTYPVKFGEKYSGKFVIPNGNLKLRTQTYRNGKPLGRELIIDREELVKRAK